MNMFIPFILTGLFYICSMSVTSGSGAAYVFRAPEFDHPR
jgi:hypothetical protein